MSDEPIELGKPIARSKPEPQDDAESGSRKQDQELLTIARIMRQMEELDPPARTRVMAYLGSRYAQQEVYRLNPGAMNAEQLRRLIDPRD